MQMKRIVLRTDAQKILVHKGKECKGGKLSKERLSVFLRCSATGERLRPMATGNAARPRVFEEQHMDTKRLPVMWFSKKKA
jgi:hypothetical protein